VYVSLYIYIYGPSSTHSLSARIHVSALLWHDVNWSYSVSYLVRNVYVFLCCGRCALICSLWPSESKNVSSLLLHTAN
jgi:hypothetical protein